jgi:hypothetical protein
MLHSYPLTYVHLNKAQIDSFENEHPPHQMLNIPTWKKRKNINIVY